MAVEPSGLVKRAIRITTRGFFLGLGFSAAVALVYYLAMLYYIPKMERQMAQSMQTAMTPGFRLKDISLTGTDEILHDGTSSIVGTATNTGTTSANGVEIQADLFEHGKFVDKYSTSISGTLAPGESQNFKISCGCKDSPPAAHDSFKVHVVKAY